MPPNCTNVFAAIPGIPTGHGGLTKPASASRGDGPIYIGFISGRGSIGQTIDFLLSPKRDVVAAKHFLQMAMWRVGGIRPRVINVDGHAAYPQAIRELKARENWVSSANVGPLHT